ncbi:MAG: hemerythrin family protein [Magnetococcales bacterium]|nr:hemerythrin family protein [Magnetococcales bacterium]
MSELSLADVGVKQFNKDHQRLLFYIVEFNRLVVRFQEREPFEDEWDQIRILFKRLDKYTKVHFKAEETLMVEQGYPLYEEHLKQHHALIDALAELKKKVKAQDARYIADIKSFLLDWLRNHINGHDLKYRDFFKEKKVD